MVPFLFTVKNLDLKGPADGFAGQFDVPSYRCAASWSVALTLPHAVLAQDVPGL